MLALTNTAIHDLNNMHAKWEKFKSARSRMKYEKDQGKGYITGMEREELIDKLFNIYLRQTEEIKVLKTPRLYE